MAIEAGTANYFNNNQVRSTMSKRSLNESTEFSQYFLVNNSIEQQDRQLENIETVLNYQLPAQQISQGSIKAAQSTSVQTQDNFQTIFEYADIGIAFIATSGQFLRVNPYLCSLLQYSESVMCSSTFQDITHTEDLKTVWQEINQVLNATQSSKTLEQRYRRQDGQWQWVRITFSLVTDSQNIPLYLIAIIEDIQARKQIEAKLQTRLAIDTAIAQISRKLISIEAINYEEILGIIGEATKCDLAHFTCLVPEEREDYTYHWNKDNQWSQLTSEKILAIDRLPSWQEKLSRDENIIIRDIEQLSGVTEQEKNILQSLKVCSALIIPILAPSGRIWGTLGLYNQTKHERDWLPDDAQQLKTLGAIIRSNYQYRVAQTKLKVSEILSDNFFHHSVNGIFLIDVLPDNQLVYKKTNLAYAKLVGKTNQEIKGKTTAEVLSPKIASIFEEKCHLCLTSKKSLDFLLTLELPGQTRYWSVDLIPIASHSRQYGSLQGKVRDITEEKQRQDRQDRQIRYRHLLRSITFKIRQSLDIQEILQTTVSELQKTFEADRVLLCQFLPDGAGKVIKESVRCGFPSILGKVIMKEYFQDLLPDRDSEGYAYICEDANNAEIPSHHRALLKKYQTQSHLILPIARYLPIKNSTSSVEKSSPAGNSLWGLLCVQQCNQSRQWTQDEIELLQHLVEHLIIALSQAELLESEINQRKELARSNAELEQFAYIASHDLQAPLQTVTNYVQLLQRRYQDRLDASGEKFIYYITDSVNRMRTQINDLLEYSRVGRQRSTFRTTDCNLVVEQAIANLRSEIDKHQAVVTYCANLPTLIADSSQLIVLFQNLISNALKYHSQAIPLIKINAERKRNYWQFSVNDNGIGISPQYKQRIFQIFQRLHTQEEYPGTGIGLAICQKIVERHGGQIKVDSQLNKGSTFYFTIPL